MAKDFDDFILWEREDPDSLERSRKLTDNFLSLLDKKNEGPDLIENALLLIDDMISERLRSYHRWVNLP